MFLRSTLLLFCVSNLVAQGLETSLVNESSKVIDSQISENWIENIKKSKYLSLETIRSLSLKKSTLLESNQIRERIAFIGTKKSFSGMLPKVMFNSQHAYLNEKTLVQKMASNDDGAYSFSLLSEWLIYDGMINLNRYKNSKLALGTEKLSSELNKRNLIRLVTNKYYAGVLILAQMNQKKTDIKFEKENLKIANHKFKAGVSSLSDVLNFELRVANAENALIDFKLQWKNILTDLATLCSIDPIHLQHLKTFKYDITAPNVTKNVQILRDDAVKNREELKIKNLVSKINENNVKISRMQYSPRVSLFHQYNSSDTSKISGYHKDKDASAIGIKLQLNLFQGLKKHYQIIEDQSHLRLSQVDVQDAISSLLQEVTKQYDTVKSLYSQMKLDKKALDVSRKKREIVQAEYTSGKVDVLRLNDAQNTYSTAETKYKLTQIYYAQAVEELRLQTVPSEDFNE